LQYLRPCWSDNRMLYGTCTISKALGASLYLIDCVWCYRKYVLGMYATLGVYCTYATVVYCMYAKITGKKNRLSPSLDTMFNRTKVPSVYSSWLWKHLSFFFPFFFSKHILSSDAVLKWVFEWLDYPSVMLSYTIPLFGCEPFLSPNKYFFLTLDSIVVTFFHFSWNWLIICHIMLLFIMQ